MATAVANVPQQAKTVVARVPYLNSAPFFRGLTLGERYALAECVPRELGERAASGEVAAGLLPLVDYFRLEDAFERIGRFGIAVRGRAQSALLFSRKPLRQLDGATIAVTEETSTTAVLLRLLLEIRYRLRPAAYERIPQLAAEGRLGPRPEADALLLIGDEALSFRQSNRQYPFEIDLAFEWWLWQHLPFVFAVLAIRKDASPQEKKHIETGLIKALAMNTGQLESIAQEHSVRLGVPAADLASYLLRFIYRLGPLEEEAIARFRALVDEHGLL